MSTPKVEIYTKWGCPYCVRAKALFDGKGVTYAEYDITLGGPKRAEMLERAPGASGQDGGDAADEPAAREDEPSQAGE